ncbi:MAG: hypothetical protein ACI4T5_07780 [Prevotella sp.]
MARRILMTGDKAKYMENRPCGSNADDRDIIMSGENASYEENVSGMVIMESETQVDSPAETEESADKNDELIDRISPIFYNDVNEAKAFLNKIRGMKATQITELVKDLRTKNIISEMSCHRDLWFILYEAGLYTKSESNWNERIK